MRRLAFLIALTAPGLLAAASAPVVAQRETVDQATRAAPRPKPATPPRN